MIDSLIFKVKIKDIPDNSEIELLKSEIDDYGLIRKQIFRLKNLKLILQNDELMIIGSISKYYFGNNLETLFRKDIESAIRRLSNDLNCDYLELLESSIYRIDVATNIITKINFFDIVNSYGDLTRFVKSYFGNKETILYKQNKKELEIYNKKLELIKKSNYNSNKELIEIFKNDEILRIETRFTKDIKKTLGKSVKLKDLIDESFYMKLIDYHKNLYFKIDRIKSYNFNERELIMNSNQIIDKFAILGIKQIGIEQIFQMIESEKKKKIINRQKAIRLKNKLKSLLESDDLIQSNNSINQIDKQFEESLRYYR